MPESIRQKLKGRLIPLALSAVFAVVGIVLAIPHLTERATPTLRMSAGPDGTRRHVVAEYLVKQAERNGLSINLEANAGTEQCLEQLKSGELDVALVSNGVVVPGDQDVMVLGAVQVEAVHILIRPSMAESGKPLTEVLRGKRINVGERGSTERILGREALAFARIKVADGAIPGDVRLMDLSSQELIDRANAIVQSTGKRKEALIAGLPDGLMILATLPSPIVQKLVEAADYRIVPMVGARAFLSDNLQDRQPNETVLEREFLERTTIPVNSYFNVRGQPAADCETVGVRLLVVARKNAPPRALKHLMKSLFEGEFPRRIPSKSPRDIATPYAVHPAAVAYLDRDKPFALTETVESIKQAFSIFGAFSAGALSLYGFFWKKKPRQPIDYFAEIRKLEMLGRGSDEATPSLPKELVKDLDCRLLKLRQNLIEDICEGRIKSDAVIANILALLKDARRNLIQEMAESTDSPRRERSAA